MWDCRWVKNLSFQTAYRGNEGDRIIIREDWYMYMLPFNLLPNLCAFKYAWSHVTSHRDCVRAVSWKNMSLRNAAQVTERHPATNGVRSSHLALALALGQRHNNCSWWRGFQGNRRAFSKSERGRKDSSGCACLVATRRPLVIYPSLLLYHAKPSGHSDKR